MSKQGEQSSRNFALPIAIMFLLFFMIAFVTGYQNPLGDVIKEMSGGNAIFSQLGTLANFIAYACMGYPAGKLLESQGYRKTALWAVTVGFTGVFITYLSGFIADNTTAVVIYLIGAFVAGFSMCMLNTVVNPMLNSLGKNPNQSNQLLLFGGSCNSVGATLAPVVVGGLIGGAASSISSANPVFFMAMAIFAVAFLVLYFTKLPEVKNFGQPKKDVIKVADVFKYRHFVFGVIAIFGYVGIEVGIANMTYQYLSSDAEFAAHNPGLNAAAIAGTVCGLYWLLMLCGRLLGGAVGSFISSRVMLSCTAAIAIVLMLCAILVPTSYMGFFGFDSANLSFMGVQVPINGIFLILIGLCTSVMWGAIFNLAVDGLGKYTAVASGLFMTMVCGGGIIPTIQAWIGGSIGILNSFWLLIVVAAYLLLYALVLSRPAKKEKFVEEDLYENGKEVKA